TSQGPGTGYTETLKFTLNSSRGWAEIVNVLGAANVVTDTDAGTATFDLGPGATAHLIVVVTVPAGQRASVEGDPSTMETSRLHYETLGCYPNVLEDNLPDLVTMVEKDDSFVILPDNFGAALPGETVTYTHVLTNVGNMTTTFTLYPKAGFYATGRIISPTSQIVLTPGMSQIITVAVTIRPEVASGLIDVTSVIAQTELGTQKAAANNTDIGAIAGTRYVATNGTDSFVDETVGGTDPGAVDHLDNNCTQPGVGACRTLRHALDQAQPGDTIKVAEGTYTTVYTTTPGGPGQVLFVNKPVTISGGFVTSDWEAAPPDHISHTTYLDPLGAGRALYVEAGLEVILERLTLTGGDTTGLGGGPTGEDAGGNLYNAGSDIDLNTVALRDGVAAIGAGFYSASGDLLLTNALIHGNGTAATQLGGGGYVVDGNLTLLNGTFHDNQAALDGGALYLDSGALSFANTIFANNDSGGGSRLQQTHAAVYAETATATGDYNLYYNNITDDVGGTVSYGANDVQGQDPAFLDPWNDPPNLDIGTSSPAREAGDPTTDLNLFPLGLDYANRPRSMGLRVDIGAYEYRVEPGVALEPDYDEVLDAGATFTYTHTLTNTGDLTDTFTLAWSSSRGWSTLLTSGPFELGMGETATVRVEVTTPASGAGGLIDTTIVTATSQTDPGSFDIATDRTQVRFTPGVTLVADESGNVDPGGAFTYTHTLTNVGDGEDTFTITSQAPAGWTAEHVAALTVGAGLSETLDVVITAPTDVFSGTTGVVTITATSTFSSTISDFVVDRTTVNRTRGVE
ncbi:MAG: hypothetical protein ACP5GX_10470, partial [Anaerolineae bacterium]